MFSSHEKFNPADALPACSQTLLLAQPLPLQQGPGTSIPAQQCSGEVWQKFQGWFGVESIRAGPWCSVWESQWSFCQENPWCIISVVSPSSPGQEQLWLTLLCLGFFFPLFLQNTPPQMGLKRFFFSLFSSLPDRPWLTEQQLEPSPYFRGLLLAGDATAHLHPSPLKQM